MESLEIDLSWSKPSDVQSEESTVSLLEATRLSMIMVVSEGLSGHLRRGLRKVCTTNERRF